MIQERFNYLFDNFKPDQTKEEMWAVIECLNTINPKNIMEIGVQFGESSNIWAQYCLDNNGMFFGIEILTERIKSNLPNLGNPSLLKYIFKGNSKDENIINQVKTILGENLFDFIFVDGGHDVDDVYQDIKNYAPLLRSGGIIAFHDYRKGLSVDQGIQQAIKDNLLVPLSMIEKKVNHGTLIMIKA